MDFAIGLVNSVFNLPNRHVKFLGSSNYKRAVINSAHQKNSWPVRANYCLPKRQAVKLTFFAPCTLDTWNISDWFIICTYRVFCALAFLNKKFKDFSRTFKDTFPIFQGLHSKQERASKMSFLVLPQDEQFLCLLLNPLQLSLHKFI